EWFKRIDWSVKDLGDKIMASQTALQAWGWGANFIENHDQPRAATKYLREAQHNADAVKTLAAMYFFLRGVPFIYQGQELGMVNFQRSSVEEFNDLSSIDQYYRSMEEGCSPEEALRYVNLRSRDNARTPFPWDSGQYGGFSAAVPWLGMTREYPEINAQAQSGREGSVLEFYRDMIRFRQHGPFRDCLIYGGIEPVESSPEVIAYRRYTKDESLLCFFNMGGSEAVEMLALRGAETGGAAASDSGFTATARAVEPVWSSRGTVHLRGARLALLPYQSVILRSSNR
uniref:alpha-amylase family glycosyl hydrolase n=1 Tax=Enterocloster asparagiformis TaxID=333367 RepID=UPI002A81F260